MTDQQTDHLEETILEIVRDDLLDAGPEFTRTTSLLDAGLDSLSLTQLLLAIEEETGIWIDESYLTRDHLQNVQTLVECVREVARETNETDALE